MIRRDHSLLEVERGAAYLQTSASRPLPHASAELREHLRGGQEPRVGRSDPGRVLTVGQAPSRRRLRVLEHARRL